jgi:hypothetical protein
MFRAILTRNMKMWKLRNEMPETTLAAVGIVFSSSKYKQRYQNTGLERKENR